MKKEKKIEREKVKKGFMLFIVASVSLFPTYIFAGSTSVTNTVTTSANSGGNVSTNGQVVEGVSKSSVSVKTVINGTVVEDYSTTTDESVRYENTVTSDTGSSTVIISTGQGGAVRSDAATKKSVQVSHTNNYDSESATHESAPENEAQSGEVESSAEEGDAQAAAASIAVESVADTRLTDAGVATRVVRGVQLFIIKIISLFSW